MSALKAIETTVYSVLSTDGVLTGLAGVYNDVPEGAAYPHVQIGSGTEHPWHTMGGPTAGLGWNDTVTVHIWSRYQGDVEALTILSRVVALLNFVALSVTGYGTVMSSYDHARVLVESVDKVETRHVPAIFRIRVHE